MRVANCGRRAKEDLVHLDFNLWQLHLRGRLAHHHRIARLIQFSLSSSATTAAFPCFARRNLKTILRLAGFLVGKNDEEFASIKTGGFGMLGESTSSLIVS